MKELSKRDYKFICKAIELSTLSEFKQFKIGCIAVYHKNIIGVGINKPKTSSVQSYFNYISGRSKTFISNNGQPIHEFIHAEIDCINMIKHMDIDFSKVKLYVARMDANQHIACCKPCIACQTAIKTLGIKEIYYTSDKDIKHLKFKNK